MQHAPLLLCYIKSIISKIKTVVLAFVYRYWNKCFSCFVNWVDLVKWLRIQLSMNLHLSINSSHHTVDCLNSMFLDIEIMIPTVDKGHTTRQHL